MTNKQHLLEHLESLSNDELPDRFYSCSEKELQDLVRYANEVVAYQNAGLDKLFESVQLTLKYIPNFVIVSMCKRFLEPPLGARITQKLEMKQVVSIGNQLPATYLAEVSAYQEPRLSADILANLKQQHANRIIRLMCERYPYKVLEVFEYLTDQHQDLVVETINLLLLSTEHLHSANRKAAFKQIQRVQNQ